MNLLQTFLVENLKDGFHEGSSYVFQNTLDTSMTLRESVSEKDFCNEYYFDNNCGFKLTATDGESVFSKEFKPRLIRFFKKKPTEGEGIDDHTFSSLVKEVLFGVASEEPLKTMLTCELDVDNKLVLSIHAGDSSGVCASSPVVGIFKLDPITNVSERATMIFRMLVTSTYTVRSSAAEMQQLKRNHEELNLQMNDFIRIKSYENSEFKRVLEQKDTQIRAYRDKAIRLSPRKPRLGYDMVPSTLGSIPSLYSSQLSPKRQRTSRQSELQNNKLFNGDISQDFKPISSSGTKNFDFNTESEPDLPLAPIVIGSDPDHDRSTDPGITLGPVTEPETDVLKSDPPSTNGFTTVPLDMNFSSEPDFMSGPAAEEINLQLETQIINGVVDKQSLEELTPEEQQDVKQESYSRIEIKKEPITAGRVDETLSGDSTEDSSDDE